MNGGKCQVYEAALPAVGHAGGLILMESVVAGGVDVIRRGAGRNTPERFLLLGDVCLLPQEDFADRNLRRELGITRSHGEVSDFPNRRECL